MSTVAAKLYLYDSECGIAAAMALLTFDYCLTFKKEAEWLFGTRWTFTRIHFTSSRYLPFVALALAIPSSRTLSPSDSESDCAFLSTATNAMYYLCIVLAEGMLIVRTYVFWRRDKKILLGMCTFAVVCTVGAVVPSETIVNQPTNSVHKVPNCFGVQGTVAAALQYIGLILYETGMLGLNWIAFQRMKQRSPGPLITTLYRDGMMYMAAILLFSVINVVVTLTKSILYSDILNSPQIVLHSILASRIFFNLRETDLREQEDVLLTALTEFHAASQGSVGLSNSMGSSSPSSGGGINTEVT